MPSIARERPGSPERLAHEPRALTWDRRAVPLERKDFRSAIAFWFGVCLEGANIFGPSLFYPV